MENKGFVYRYFADCTANYAVLIVTKCHALTYWTGVSVCPSSRTVNFFLRTAGSCWGAFHRTKPKGWLTEIRQILTGLRSSTVHCHMLRHMANDWQGGRGLTKHPPPPVWPNQTSATPPQLAEAVTRNYRKAVF